jgi:hypothetical protein
MSDFPLLLANEIGVSRRTATRWCAAGKIPGAYRTKGGHWRLRRPRGGVCGLIGYNQNIANFVLRYTSEEGYTPPPIDEFALALKICKWAARQLSGSTPLSRTTVKRAIEALEWAKMILNRRFVEEMEQLTATKEFNTALEFSEIALGISEADHPPVTRDYKSWISWKERVDPEKHKFLMETPLLEMIRPRAYGAVAAPNGLLMIKAEKLRVNKRAVTQSALARELKISVKTLCRRYGRENIRSVCKTPSASPLPAVTLPASWAEKEFPDRADAKKTPTTHLNRGADPRTI